MEPIRWQRRKWLKELAALSTPAANRHPVDEFIQDPETAWPCHFKATERGDYDDFVCAKCGKVAGRLYYQTILTTDDRRRLLWFIPDFEHGVFSGLELEFVITRLRRNRTCCRQFNDKQCYWCGWWARCSLVGEEGRFGRRARCICRWCHEWHKGYVRPQLVERMTHTLKAGRLLPRMPVSVHCIIAEYLVSMCEVRRSFPPLYHIPPHVRHGRGHEASDLRSQCRGN